MEDKVEALKKTVAEKERTIAEKDRAIVEKTGAMDLLKKEIQALRGENGSLKTAIAKKDEEIQKMKG